MANSRERVKDFPSIVGTIQSDDYIPVDGATQGVRKAQVKDIMDAPITGLDTIANTTKGAINELATTAGKVWVGTQDEYDALPDTKLTDNVLHCITDGEPSAYDSIWDKVGTDPLDTTASDCSGAINELKQSLSQLGITCESVINNATITTSETSYNTYSGRKFSDYALLIFLEKYTDEDIRASMIIPSYMWKSGGMIPLKALHGSTAAGADTYSVGGMTFRYNSDTSIYMFTNGSNTFSVASVVGVKFNR